MGEVYKARDSRLDRTLALKILPPEVAKDPDRIRRFEVEARATSVLRHPNIAVVYDVGTTDSIQYIAMELIEGKTLRDLLLPGPLSVKRLLDIACQIAEGLASAHDAGIVHRDLKPRNVMLTKQGVVKILDFGLAKVPARADDVTPLTDASTASATGTADGEVMGTVEYMSPEQARGQRLDYRSDQFSFGAVLYEMATGQRAFAGLTRMDTLAAILQEEPAPISRERPSIPPPLRWLIARCLAKVPADRYVSTEDLARELRNIRDHLEEVTGKLGESLGDRRSTRLRRGLVAIVGAAAAAAVLFLSLPSIGSRKDGLNTRFRRLTFRRGYVSRALFLPNSILYTAAWEGGPSLTYSTLPESAGVDRALDAEPQFPLAVSADGSQVLVVLVTDSLRAGSVPGTLAWWPALGGRPRRILDDVIWADWAPMTQRLATVEEIAGERQLMLRDADGRLLRALYRTPGSLSFLRFSPDETQVAFIHHPEALSVAGEVRLASTATAGSRPLTDVFPQCFGLDWHPQKHEIWFTASPENLLATSLWSVTALRKPKLIHALPDVFILNDISPDGQRIAITSRRDQTRLLVRSGNKTPKDLSWFDWTFVSDISPAADSVLFWDVGPTQETFGLWVRPLDGGDAIHMGKAHLGKFSPDGRWVVAVTYETGASPQLILVPNGPGQSRRLTSGSAAHWAPSFAGQGVILFVRSEGSKRRVWRMAADGTGSRPAGDADCDFPMANPSLDGYVCIGGPGQRSLQIHPMDPGAGRRLYELPPGRRFRYARWNQRGDEILAATSDGHFMRLNSRDGTLASDLPLPLPNPEAYGSLQSASFDAIGRTLAYSVSQLSSSLYLGSGF